MQSFTIHLTFLSFLKIATIIGFCFGVALVPIIILFGVGQIGFLIIPIALIVSPIVGILEGFLAGLIGYSVYLWLSQGVGFESQGNLYVHGQEALRGSHS